MFDAIYHMEEAPLASVMPKKFFSAPLTGILWSVQGLNRPPVTYQQPGGISLAAVPRVYRAAFATVPDGDHSAPLSSFSTVAAAIAAVFSHNEDELAITGHHENFYVERAPNGSLAREVFCRPKLCKEGRMTAVTRVYRDTKSHASLSVTPRNRASKIFSRL